ncbi:cysteine methyltransferase [Pseudoroseomonas deserti]|uniref:Methylated-DNA--protein-cysteine methyltransferase n=1 Tax=Teichococcus deserti TaxID=1817963 RepID=A0A1V2H004_9PROT|nr:methylated-DNA--[protein]-cysteine S-methyltransferase [Pseudoroseomonas deserti]ONG50883.1 cysteine methyltransferase [Pseudoroseomonas deserti]
MLRRHTIASPVGPLTLYATDTALHAILWPGENPRRIRLAEAVDAPSPVLDDTIRQLNQYFAGTRQSFDLPLAENGTPFQRSHWAALRAIPYGETRSYAALASQAGKPGASRAIGAANGRNPISIVTPCHRAIGSSGALTGFAGGLDAKRWLLDLEARHRR